MLRNPVRVAAVAVALLAGGLTAAAVSGGDAPTVRHHVVVAGESWSAIARSEGVTLSALLVANNARSTDALFPGRVLHVVSTEVPTSTTTPNSATTTSVPSAPPSSTNTSAPTTTAPTPSIPQTTATSPSSSSDPSTTTTSVPPSTTDFLADFTTDQRALFDWQLHTSDNGGINTKIAGTFQGEHDRACNPPDTFRTVTGGQGSSGFVDVSGSDLIWYCGNDPAKGHVMTALDTTDIATLSFSPKTSFTNVTRVCWDQNMNDLGEGKWLNVFVVPAADVAAHRGNLNYAAATGLPFGGINQLLPAGAFDFTWLRGTTFVNGREIAWKSYIPGGMATSSAPRFRVCLDSSGSFLTIARPDGTTDRYFTGATFPTGDVKVIFQDASYNPTKHNGSDVHLTWHWDNLTVGAS